MTACSSHFGALEGDEASWAHLYGANSSIKRSSSRRVGVTTRSGCPTSYEDIDWAIRAGSTACACSTTAARSSTTGGPMSVDV
jgi:hypothetical protein